MRRLKAMDEAETEELVAAVIGAARLPPGLGAMISRSADGNPLFIEEACYSLLESGALSVENCAVVLHQSLDQLLLPDTVQALIRARLDRLDKGAKEVIGPASVIGRVFSERVLASIYSGRSPLAEALEVLQAHEIIQQTKILPEPEYGFRHLLMREVAYETLFHQQRKQLHEAVGSAIGFIRRARRKRAHFISPLFPKPACGQSRAARAAGGRAAARLYANTEASAYFRDALDIVKSLPVSAESQRWQIDAILGQVGAGGAPGDIERDRRNLEQACELAERLGDRRRRAQALYWLGRTHYLVADLHTAIEHARRSLEISDELEDAALAAPPVNLMGRAIGSWATLPDRLA
jgi:tetratricopeptide (TPR) repeat protein